MTHRIDSAQIVAAIGMAASFVASNYDRLAATACALAATGYTLWKWRRAARREREERE